MNDVFKLEYGGSLFFNILNICLIFSEKNIPSFCVILKTLLNRFDLISTQFTRYFAKLCWSNSTMFF